MMLFVLNINFFFFFLFLLFFFLGMYFHMFNLSLILTYNFFSLNSCIYSVIFLFDWLSLIFLSVVFMISGCVFLYSLGYMRGDNFIIRFYFLVFMFVLSMFFLIIMPDIICLMLGWDGLGLVSYCLVIYYQNLNSLSSGYLTLFINRLGDMFLILCICWSFNYGCWHYLYFFSLNSLNYYMFIFLVLSCLTSSAQFPFSSWLPAAMAAPTPVSSLVHSSTLVTAGVYLLIRFNKFISIELTLILLNLSLLTIMLSGMGALYENDLKKIIAFSTMGQLSFMIFSILMGSYYLSFLHLLIHAVFKSLLFLCSGIFISGFMGVQDIRYMGNLGFQSPLISSSFLISLFSLCGLPFYSGFFSSDFIVEMVILTEVNLFYFILFFLSIYLTLIYSLRLFFYLYMNSVKMNLFNFSGDFYMNISCLILLILSIFFGSSLFWLLNLSYINVFDEIYKYLVLFFFIYFFIFTDIFSLLNMNVYNFMGFFMGQMWFLPFFSSKFIVSKFFNLSHLIFLVTDLGWTEYLISLNLINNLRFVNIYLNKFLLNSFKVYLMFFVLIMILMMIF
uniref:NADH-ubiquinone oxidoreductase chain 5 n=1 Tax=Nilaparvata muiri TaxID=706586 RepID=A0A075B8Z3_NILMU|nr:NADH dehydrogenase subunit 5 [Nilaparvata muiri]AEP27298.1 NADH dehydrogenase subunit 5 [Nilaparvata muiri]